jgi:diaminopimelate decarboxylase
VERERILVHGVNKTQADLQAALTQAGIIVIDHLGELQHILRLIESPATSVSQLPEFWLRVRPGVAVETHSYRQTGQEDSKFGMSVVEAAQAVALCKQQGLHLSGLHFHQGSHFHDPSPIGPAIATIYDLLVELRQRSGWLPTALCPGGGWGVPYHEDDLPHPAIEDYVAFVARKVVEECRCRGLELPRLHLEPGRSLVARGGVALYRVGGIKQTGQRRWILIDGGMADNPRPALYKARYSALPVQQPRRPFADPAWIGGPYCESGDVLIEELPLPDMAEGELLVVPVAGAYQLMMGSNYNGARKPAALWLYDGNACLIQRRQTPADLIRFDLPLPENVVH